MSELRDKTYFAAIGALDKQTPLQDVISRGDQRRLIAGAADWYLAEHKGTLGRGGTCVVVTAGPAGSGKTTVVKAAVADWERRRVIDPDIAKRYLARWCVERGLYGDVLGTVLPDGRTMQPMELAPLLQTMSIEVANSVRRVTLASGEDVIMEATLGSESYGERLLRSLAKAADYTDLLIVSAEISRAAAHERARSRWWGDRWTDALGGAPSQARRNRRHVRRGRRRECVPEKRKSAP
jgi:hypothetical protein